ncbi:hypothetical protein BJ741DRAFT_587332 [Chytriomyces cf. hyalinus JEL632]|nr:hypothetical protein BJ741DRAFT_587332 [Chytriomyces cf. hyalinus JEL632]
MLVESDWLTASDQVSNPTHGFQTSKRKMGPKATLASSRSAGARITSDARGVESAQNTAAPAPPTWALPPPTTIIPPQPPLTFKRKRREKERKSAGGLFSILSQMATASTLGPTQVDGGVVLIGDAYSGLSAIPPSYGVAGAVSGASSPAPAPTGRRQRFANACASCQRSHVSCGGERPCARCLKRGEACVDAPKKDKDKPATVTATPAANMAEVATPPDIAMPDPSVPPPLSTLAVPPSVCVSCPLKPKPAIPEAQRVLKPLLPRPMSAPSAAACAANPAITACARLSSTSAMSMSPALGHSPHSSSSSSPFVQFRPNNDSSGIAIDDMNSNLLNNDSLLFQLHDSSESILQSNLNSSLDSMMLDFAADLNSSSHNLHASSYSVNGTHSDLLNLARSSMQVDAEVHAFSTNPNGQTRTDSNQMAGNAVLFSNQDFRFLNWLGLGTNDHHASLLDTAPSSSTGGNPLVDSMQYSSAIMNNVFLQGPENASNQPGGEQFLSGGGVLGGSNSIPAGFGSAACLGDGLAMSSCPITRPHHHNHHHQQHQQTVLKSDGKPNIVIGADSPGVFGDLDKFLESLQQSTHTTDLGAGVGNRAKRKRAKLAAASASQMPGGYDSGADAYLDGSGSGSLAVYSHPPAGAEAVGVDGGIGYGSDGQGSWMEALGIRDGPTSMASDNLLFGDGAVGISRIKENGVLEW